MSGFSVTLKAGEVRAMLLRGEKQTAIILAQQITAEAQLVMRESKRRVPFKFGVLKSSGQVRPAKVQGNTKVQAARLSYGGAASAYAWYQHREHNPPFHYSKPGTGPNYLAGPMKERQPEMTRLLKTRIVTMLRQG